MPNTTTPGILSYTGLETCTPARTPGCLGLNDQGDPQLCTRLGDTPNCTGVRDGADASLPWWNPAAPPTQGPVRASDGTPMALPVTAPPLAPADPVPWIKIAEDQARKFKGQDEAIIQKTTNYAKEVGTGQTTLVGNEHPWCAAFVNWCLMKAGVPVDNPAFADHVAAKGRAHGFYQVKGPKVAKGAKGSDKGQPMVRNPLFVELDAPVFGAIAMVTNSDGHGHHVGFVYSQPAPDFVVLLGGNQSNTIRFSNFNVEASKASSNHLLFFFPAGDGWSSKSAPALGAQKADDLNKLFGISTPAGSHADTTR
jgi:hypothetical protein